MKTYKNKIGVTLTEMLVVVAVIVVLASLVITAATRIRNQSNEQLAENTIATLTAALQQFRDFGYKYKNSSYYLLSLYPDRERRFYLGLDFPPDCNDFGLPSLPTFEEELTKVLDAVVIGDVAHDPNYSGSEAMYFFLSRVPESRKTLDKIDGSLITDEDDYGNRMKVTIDGRPYPLLRVIDPWGTTLHYDYYDERAPIFYNNQELRLKSKRTFPVITSAGPDKIFGTADDISSRN